MFCSPDNVILWTFLVETSIFLIDLGLKKTLFTNHHFLKNKIKSRYIVDTAITEKSINVIITGTQSKLYRSYLISWYNYGH